LQIAADKGFALKPDGLYLGKKLVASARENDIYDALGLQFIEPELRKGRDELTRAAKHSLPTLVGDADLHGIRAVLFGAIRILHSGRSQRVCRGAGCWDPRGGFEEFERASGFSRPFT
jgi:hypothetical protein